MDNKELIVMERDTMQTANEYMIKLMQGVVATIQDFRAGNNEEAISKASYIEEGLQWMSEVARLTKDIQCEEMDEVLLSEKLEMLVDAYENEDHNLMGDVLEFEIHPLLEQWHSVIKAAVMN